MQSFSELEQEARENFLPWQYSLKCCLRLHWSWQTHNQILISLKMFHFLITLRKWPLLKSLQQQRVLIRVLFSRHALEGDRVPFWRLVSASVYFSFWGSSEVISGGSAETGDRCHILCALLQSLCSRFQGGKFGTLWVAAQLQMLSCYGSQGTDRPSPPLQNPPDDESQAL